MYKEYCITKIREKEGGVGVRERERERGGETLLRIVSKLYWKHIIRNWTLIPS